MEGPPGQNLWNTGPDHPHTFSLCDEHRAKYLKLGINLLAKQCALVHTQGDCLCYMSTSAAEDFLFTSNRMGMWSEVPPSTVMYLKRWSVLQFFTLFYTGGPHLWRQILRWWSIFYVIRQIWLQCHFGWTHLWRQNLTSDVKFWCWASYLTSNVTFWTQGDLFAAVSIFIDPWGLFGSFWCRDFDPSTYSAGLEW